MTNRQARINRLKAAFQKVEQLMKEGYVVQWDGEVIEKIVWSQCDLHLETNYENWVTQIRIYSERSDVVEFHDMADMNISEINKELSERLTVWKKVEAKI